MKSFLLILPIMVAGLVSPGLRTALLDEPALLSSVSASADTVHAGETFIAQLPDSLSGDAIATWELEKPPVWSLLRERSFFWKTFEKDLGIHELRFQAITKERGDTLAYPIQLIIL